jgi:L-ascorbate metabolism protein UlaG (beta-lactamase superfamily)
MKALIGVSFGLALLFASTAGAAPIEVLGLGHGTVRIKTVEGKTIVIDPFLVKNPSTPPEYRALGKVDLILVTHGHTDHVDDLAELVKLSDAPVVLNFDLAIQMQALGLLDPAKMIGMNKSGTVSPLGRGIETHMAPAEHSSSLDLVAFDLFDLEQATPESPRLLEGGVAMGYVIELENGFTIYSGPST